MVAGYQNSFANQKRHVDVVWNIKLVVQLYHEDTINLKESGIRDIFTTDDVDILQIGR